MRTLAERYRLNAERMQTAARLVETVLDDLPREGGLTESLADVHRTLRFTADAMHSVGADLTDASEEAPRG